MSGGTHKSLFKGSALKQASIGAGVAALVAVGLLVFGWQSNSIAASDGAEAQALSKSDDAALVRVAEAATGADQQIDAKQRGQIERIVREYLLKNPELLLEMQTELERRMEVAQKARMKTALADNADSLFRSERAPIVGNKDGDVTVVEFFDYNCGFCRRAIAGMSKLVDDDKNVKVVFKEFPILSKGSEEAARVALAAEKQGKYWELHRALLETPGRADLTKGLRLAKKFGLDIDKLKEDMESDEVKAEIASVQKLADAMGIRGTPHFIIGDKVIPGAPEDLYDQLKARVKEVRQNGCQVC